MPGPSKALLCSPEHFKVVDEKNAHMKGNIGMVDQARALEQWKVLRDCYESLRDRGMLDEVSVLEATPGCEDMVFCANQSFPWLDGEGDRVVIMSNMRHASRKNEVPAFERFYKEQGYNILHLPEDVLFEGMGDLIPHPGQRLLYGGYGHRTGKDAYAILENMLVADIIPLELVSTSFYHLDTCFLPISEKSVLVCREAFTKEGLQQIGSRFEQMHFIPEAEATGSFSLNAHVLILGGHKIAILQEGSRETRRLLLNEGCELMEIDTSEFMKSGGSVFCMKMMYY
jgi:N-dimethylarginine dimethylaminohydrolase